MKPAASPTDPAGTRVRGTSRRGTSYGQSARIKTLVLVFFVQVPAWAYLGGWFLYQLQSAHESLFSASAEGGVAFFAHVGGFVFGWIVARALREAGQVHPQTMLRRPSALPLL